MVTHLYTYKYFISFTKIIRSAKRARAFQMEEDMEKKNQRNEIEFVAKNTVDALTKHS